MSLRRGRPLAAHLRARDEQGEVAEVVLVLPVLMGFLLFVLQVALWALASHALTLAVTEGGAVARAAFGNNEEAVGVVSKDVHSMTGSLVGSLHVVVRSLPGDVVSVSASGVVMQLLPGFRLRVDAESLGPEQGFRASG